MAILPEQPVSLTRDAIFASYEKAAKPRMSRRLGTSIIGKKCERAIWYDFRWAQKESFDGRMLRLFETGQLEENRIAANLRAIGCQVHLVDPDTNQQFEFTDVGGHFICKIDAAVLGIPDAPKTWHVAEIKTMSGKRFSELQSKGLFEAKKEHYAQLLIGMKLAGMTRGIYIAVCKDTDEIYTTRLRMEECEPHLAMIQQRAKRVIEAKTPPPKISEKIESMDCRYCCHQSHCHGSVSPNPGVPAFVNCRTCIHSTPVTTGTLGTWRCEKHGKNLSEAEQLRGCADHLFIPDFITFADPQDSAGETDGDWISYKNKDGGAEWKQGRQKNHYKSIELTVLPSPLVGAGVAETVKQEFGGEVVGVQ